MPKKNRALEIAEEPHREEGGYGISLDLENVKTDYQWSVN